MSEQRRDRPWVFRTYSGHSSAVASNELYKKNLAKGQTGLSVAFDLPTQTGYDADSPAAFGEVGKVGVPIGSISDMRQLFDGLPLDEMNTSMTINATAPWLLALYVAVAQDQGVDISKLRGTTQNDIQKEYLSRGTFVFPPAESLRLTVDTIAFCDREIPKWNPVNVCPYHLQEAGATPEQELAFGLCAAMEILDWVRDSGQVPDEDFDRVCGSISFFVDASIRFVEEVCKMRAFTQMWDGILEDRYGVENPKYRRFRYGVQVNSLELTEQQPENNVARIVLEMLGVTLSADARARALQLPAWNEALGLPRAWDQQWSLRMQQVLAFETDLLDYDDIFAGSHVIEAKTAELVAAAEADIALVRKQGGMIAAIENGYVKGRLVESNAERVADIESGERIVVGVNKYVESEPSPLTADAEGGILTVDPRAEREQIERMRVHRANRDDERVAVAIEGLVAVAESGANIMPASIEAAHAGVTTGEWSDALRGVYGEYRAPTGISTARAPRATTPDLDCLCDLVRMTSEELRRPFKIVLGKPGLDGHSNGVEQIAMRARDVGMEVIYEGIRLSPAQIVQSAIDEDAHVLGISILSGSHRELVPEILRLLREGGRSDMPVVAGGIIPDRDAQELTEAGIGAVYTPKDFELNPMLGDIVNIVREANSLEPRPL